MRPQKTMIAAEPPASFQAALIFGMPLLVLALGHMLSTLLRTMPAIAADLISADLDVSLESLATLAGAYHFAFAAGQIPVGVALDRYGVRPVSLTLLAIVAVGAVLSAMVGGPMGFLIAQIVLGIGSCGLLLCPMTLAAKLLTPAQFGLWSGLIQGLGSGGMLLSASPMAWLIEAQGWRAGFLASAGLAVIIAGLVYLAVPRPKSGDVRRTARLGAEALEVIRIGLSPALRGVVILAFTTFAAAIAVRGLWGGPWLMQIKGLTRIEAGNALLPFTLALVIGPMLYGVLDRRIGHRRMILILAHLLGGIALLLVAAGGPGAPLSSILGVVMLPASYDVVMFLIFGIGVAVQPLLFAMGRAAIPPEHAGKALAAVNLSFFLGASVLQAMTTPLASALGIAAVLVFLALVLIAGAIAFARLTRPGADQSVPAR